MTAEQIQHQINATRERVELATALHAVSLELQRLKLDREVETLRTNTSRMREKLEAVERREADAREIVFRAACSGIAVSPLMAAMLAEGEPVFAHADIVFPVKTFISLDQAIDELRSLDPSLFRGVEPVVAEPHDDEIEAHRRDRWGDVPNEG